MHPAPDSHLHATAVGMRERERVGERGRARDGGARQSHGGKPRILSAKAAKASSEVAGLAPPAGRRGPTRRCQS